MPSQTQVARDPKRTVRKTAAVHLIHRQKTPTDPHPGADLVTQYDRAVENMISTSLKEKYPDYV